MNFYEVVGWIATVLSSIELIPQMVQTFVLLSAAGISAFTITMFLFASVAWTIYGAGIDSWQVIICSILQLIASAIITWFKLFDYTRSQTRKIICKNFERCYIRSSSTHAHLPLNSNL